MKNLVSEVSKCKQLFADLQQLMLERSMADSRLVNSEIRTAASHLKQHAQMKSTLSWRRRRDTRLEQVNIIQRCLLVEKLEFDHNMSTSLSSFVDARTKEALRVPKTVTDAASEPQSPTSDADGD